MTEKRRQIRRRPARLTAEELKTKAHDEAEDTFRSLCLDPLKRATNGNDIPHVRVSSTRCRSRNASVSLLTCFQLVLEKSDLVNLVEVTSGCVDDRVRLTWNTAQRVNLKESIDTTIEYASLIAEENFPLTDANLDLVGLVARVSERFPQDLFCESHSAEFWKKLPSSADFPYHSLDECLNIIHQDILSVWNFNAETEVSRVSSPRL